mmetsp:Transcript_37822/g.63529  ORF Transcript_37822/g.63529 Transcript_37822/m.63529 type:complete len:398 (+) Transcript_37822:102-1295(+)
MLSWADLGPLSGCVAIIAMLVYQWPGDIPFLKPPRMKKTQQHILGFGGCLHHDFHPWEIFDAVAAAKVDKFIFMGDFIYADWPDSSRGLEDLTKLSENEYKHRLNGLYEGALNDQKLLPLLRSEKIYFMWNDHEIFDNYDQGPDTMHYKIAKDAFQSHLTSKHNPSPVDDGELYFTFSNKKYEYEVFVLDTRSFRSPMIKKDGPTSEKTMLGEKQLGRLLEWLSRMPKNSWKLLVSSCMWNDYAATAVVNGDANLDGWARYKTERDQILQYIRERGIRNVVLLSADANWSGIFKFKQSSGIEDDKARIDNTIYEFSVSPLAAPPLDPQLLKDDPEHVVHVTKGKTNVFGWMDFSENGGDSLTFKLFHYRPEESQDSNRAARIMRLDLLAEKILKRKR